MAKPIHEEYRKMVREVKNLTNIRLTESDTDGIWLHFEGGGKMARISLGSLFVHGDITNEAVESWAREQLDKQKVAHRRFYLHPQNEIVLPSDKRKAEKEWERENNVGLRIHSRPSPPVDGGY